MSENTNTQVEQYRSGQIQVSDGRLTETSISSTKEQMQLAEQMVNQLLVNNVDYGVTPGTKGPGLWDPGAAKIIRAFGLHAEHRFPIPPIDNEYLISWTVETLLVNRAGEIMGSGLGSCSTRETKYKYRWVTKEEAKREGYTEEDISELKSKILYNEPRFRIENPEYGELTNTILAMAAKRSECDAAKSLPGVGSALRAQFGIEEKGGKNDLSLPIFWSMMKGSNISEDDVHKSLKVKSLKDWTSSGKTLREAATLILKLAVAGARMTVKKEAPASAPAPKEVQPKPTPAPKEVLPPEPEYVDEEATPFEEQPIDNSPKTMTPQDITSKHIQETNELLYYAKMFWDMEEADVWAAADYRNRQNFEEAGVQKPYEVWLQIREKMLG